MNSLHGIFFIIIRMSIYTLPKIIQLHVESHIGIYFKLKILFCQLWPLPYIKKWIRYFANLFFITVLLWTLTGKSQQILHLFRQECLILLSSHDASSVLGKRQGLPPAFSPRIILRLPSNVKGAFFPAEAGFPETPPDYLRFLFHRRPFRLLRHMQGDHNAPIPAARSHRTFSGIRVHSLLQTQSESQSPESQSPRSGPRLFPSSGLFPSDLFRLLLA